MYTHRTFIQNRCIIYQLRGSPLLPSCGLVAKWFFHEQTEVLDLRVANIERLQVSGVPLHHGRIQLLASHPSYRLLPPWSACKTRENSQHTNFLCGVGCMQQVSAAGLGAGWTTPSSPYTLRKLGNYLSNSSKLRHHDCGARVNFVGRSHTMSGIWYENESARLLIYSYMHMQLIFCPLAVWLVWLFWQGLVAASIHVENWAPVKIKYVCDIHTVINIVLLLLHRKLELLKKIRLCIKSMMPRMIFYA